MRHATQDPKEIRARFDGFCKETGKPIKKGELCIYYPSNRAIYHPESNQAQSYRERKADLSLGYDY